MRIIKNLRESSLSRLYAHNKSCDIGFVTAFKNTSWVANKYNLERNADTVREADKINRDRNKELLGKIKALGYSCFKVRGSYENQERKEQGADNYLDKEESFAVINGSHNDHFADDIHKLGNLYNQESVLVVYAGGEKAEFIYSDGSREDAGHSHYGIDSPYKSLINGRPFIMTEADEEKTLPNIKSESELSRYKNSNTHINRG